jgi:hypothetical protein
MALSWWGLTATALALIGLQLAASWPWRLALSLRFRRTFLEPATVLREFGLAAAVGLFLGLWLYANSDPTTLAAAGRVWMSFLHVQLGADLFVLALWVMLRFWPKGGAVAHAAFLEGLREPKFWFLVVIAAVLLGLAPFVPYFTFGEDLKMMKEICFAFTMFAPALYGVLTGSMSVADEIEGRTAVTLMSKPISRRQFLLGKYFGILMTCLAMTLMLGWIVVWLIIFKPKFDGPRLMLDPIPDPEWPRLWAQSRLQGTAAMDLARGALLWVHDAGDALPEFIMGFCQVMIMTACSVAMATRLTMVVNIVMCLMIYFLGHLTVLITSVTAQSYKLVHFMAQLFNLLLPEMLNFDISNAVTRDAPLPPWEFATYTFYVTLYGLMYTAIVLLLGLIFFEDRDLA